VTDVPISFDAVTVDETKADGFLGDVLRQVVSGSDITDSLISLYQLDLDADTEPFYNLITWHLKAFVSLPGISRHRPARDLFDEAEKIIRDLGELFEYDEVMPAFGRGPFEQAAKVQQLAVFRVRLRSTFKEIAASGSLLLLRKANKLLQICDRLIVIGSFFPNMTFSRAEYHISVSLLRAFIRELHNHDGYRILKKFVDQHKEDLCQHPAEFLALLDKINWPSKSSRLMKAKLGIRMHYLLLTWMSERITEADMALSITRYQDEYLTMLPEIETDGIDLPGFRLPPKDLVTEIETDPQIWKCKQEFDALPFSTFQSLVFFKTWLEFLKTFPTPGRVWLGIREAWNLRLRIIEEKSICYRPAPILLKFCHRYACRLADVLSRVQNNSLAADSVSFFRKLETDLGQWAGDYWGPRLIPFAPEIKQASNALKKFKQDVSELDGLIPEYGIWFLANSIHVCLLELLDFMAIFGRAEEQPSIRELFHKCSYHLNSFRSSIEHRHFDHQMLPFYQTLAHNCAVFTRLMSQCLVPESINQFRLSFFAQFWIGISQIAHLADPEKAKFLFENLSTLLF
jgi:hypothetical protein